jgi:hypothetical protein
VRSSRASEGGSGAEGLRNSSNEGMALMLFLKYVRRRRGAEGFAEGSSWAVAKLRIGPEGIEIKLLEAWIKGGAFKHLNRLAVTAAILVGWWKKSWN